MIKQIPIIEYNNGNIISKEDSVLEEYELSVRVNQSLLTRMICTQTSLENLVVGHLFCEELIRGVDDIDEITLNKEMGIIDIRIKSGEKETDVFPQNAKAVQTLTTTGKKISCVQVDFIPPFENGLTLSYEYILNRVESFSKRSTLFKDTGSTHSCLLCDEKDVLCFEEDISRHNALDKIIGHIVIYKIAVEDKFIITSGRVPSDMIVKFIKTGVSFAVSRSAPTTAAIKLAKEHNMTLIGFARGSRMNIYSGDHRVISQKLI